MKIKSIKIQIWFFFIDKNFIFAKIKNSTGQMQYV